MSDQTKIPGATPGDDTSGLIQRQLTDRASRNAAELDAISRAYNKHVYRARRKGAGKAWLTEPFIRKVHYDMFGEIWQWAGKYRTVPVNIGVDFHIIPEQVKLLCGDFSFWNSDKSKMAPFEIAVRLQNRLTRIHPFANGNGRHARLITDVYFYSVRLPLPKWPQIQLLSEGEQIRSRYIEAMKTADQEDYRGLIAFMKALCE